MKENKNSPAIFAGFRTVFAVMIIALATGCSAPKPPLSFDGTDACEHAKQMLIVANETCKEDCSSIFPRISGNAQNQVMVTAHAVKAVCSDLDSDDKDGTWACAEGHSCK